MARAGFGSQGRLRLPHRRPWAAGFLAALGCSGASACWSHSFGTPYVLPIPYWLYVYGCAGTLIVTFGVLGLFSSDPGTERSRRAENSRSSGVSFSDRHWILRLLRLGALLTLLLTLVSGAVGTEDPGQNIGMTLFWVIFLLGFAYLTLLAGDLYALINPYGTLVAGLERLGADLTTARLRYPPKLGSWPAFLLYLVLIWTELFTTPTPTRLSILLGIYTAITLTGVVLFGKAAWFGEADFFSVFFRLIGTMAPLHYQQTGHATWTMRWRIPFSGVIGTRPAHLSVVLFVLFMLSSTTYDGMYETQVWTAFFWQNALAWLQPLWGNDMGAAQRTLMGWFLIYRKAGLLIFPFLYLGIYLVALLVAKWLARSTLSIRSLALQFCYSLLPIAFAYNFAHYYTFLVAQLAALPWLISDPFGLGWNLLGLEATGTASTLNMGVLWHTQVAAILLGHVLGVALAHRIAVRVFQTRRQVIMSQLPMLLLMVAYTMVGLWILTLPLDG